MLLGKQCIWVLRDVPFSFFVLCEVLSFPTKQVWGGDSFNSPVSWPLGPISLQQCIPYLWIWFYDSNTGILCCMFACVCWQDGALMSTPCSDWSLHSYSLLGHYWHPSWLLLPFLLMALPWRCGCDWVLWGCPRYFAFPFASGCWADLDHNVQLLNIQHMISHLLNDVINQKKNIFFMQNGSEPGVNPSKGVQKEKVF